MIHTLKMTPEKIKQIKKACSTGNHKKRHRARLHLAREYGVSYRTILDAQLS